MNRTYTIYDNATGAIARLRNGPEETLALQYDALSMSAVEAYCDVQTDYVDLSGPSVQPKPDMPASIDKTSIAADGVDAAVMTLPTTEPNGTAISVWVLVEGQRYEVSDGVFEFTIDTPGEYAIRCQGTNYKENVFTVTAT
jgi:hypothetical protein